MAAHVPGKQGPGPGGAHCVYVGGRGAGLATSVLCVTLPSKGPVLSVPREPQPKLRREGGEGCRMAVGHSMADCSVSAGSFLGTWKASVASPTPFHCRQPLCFPNALCLGTLPQNMQYVWVTMSSRLHPHPGQPLDSKGRGCHSLPSALPADRKSVV